MRPVALERHYLEPPPTPAVDVFLLPLPLFLSCDRCAGPPYPVPLPPLLFRFVLLVFILVIILTLILTLILVVTLSLVFLLVLLGLCCDLRASGSVERPPPPSQSQSPIAAGGARRIITIAGRSSGEIPATGLATVSVFCRSLERALRTRLVFFEASRTEKQQGRNAFRRGGREGRYCSFQLPNSEGR